MLGNHHVDLVRYEYFKKCIASKR